MAHRTGKVWMHVAAVLAIALVATACGGDEGETVDVTLQEFAIAADPTSVGAGEVTFDTTNDGPDDPHELVVFRSDLAPDALPTQENGAVDESGEGVELIDEIEEFPVGETQSMTLDLEAGNYVLVCNIYDEDEDEAHYQEGMRLAFTVE
ncbi:MAG TPA: hypothetical protein VFT80_11690 [Actinomycetota bacterium]|nr:hypothetical protein [Actinomycetota bacterium]